MDSKSAVLSKMGLTKLGKKTQYKDYDKKGREIHINVGDEVVMEITRGNGSKDFVMGRYDDVWKVYRIAYDPNASAGRIISINTIYV